MECKTTSNGAQNKTAKGNVTNFTSSNSQMIEVGKDANINNSNIKGVVNSTVSVRLFR
ncbi:hypothetical protein SAMN04487825_104148 [Prevotella sp. kh1p2]|nr:hypothetical protein SAMN04487825_104148 [Prevotella sp. kh1p2]SNU10758.1 hypothetical protein SAMN06298210_104148 [Prevotellaceae bacterium KH2P17]